MLDVIKGFLSEYSVIIETLAFLIYVVFGFLLFCKTKNINILLEVFETVKKLFYRTESEAFDNCQNEVGQGFSETKPTYRLNEACGELELDGEINIQELINSSVSIALERVLERFLPPQSEIDSDVVAVNRMQDDLDVLSNAFDLAETYREKYDLPLTLSTEQIFDRISKMSDDLKVKINDAMSKKQTVEEIKSEVISNEKKNVEESK